MENHFFLGMWTIHCKIALSCPLCYERRKSIKKRTESVFLILLKNCQLGISLGDEVEVDGWSVCPVWS